MKGYTADQLDQALEDVKVVVIPAGVPRKVCSSLVQTHNKKFNPARVRSLV